MSSEDEDVFFKLKKLYLNYNFKKYLKVTFYLHLLQNIGCIPHAVHDILEHVLHPIVCASHFPPLILLPSLVTTSLFSISESMEVSLFFFLKNKIYYSDNIIPSRLGSDMYPEGLSPSVTFVFSVCTCRKESGTAMYQQASRLVTQTQSCQEYS